MENKLKTLTMKSIGITIPVGGGDFLGKPVMAVHGLVDGYFLKTTAFGENVALSGEFNAVNPLTGECYMANIAYLPGDFADMIRGKLEARKDSAEQVEFSAQISVVKSDRGARGYTFVAEPIQTVEVYNRRRQTLETLKSKLQALPHYESQKVEQITAKKKAS